MVLARKCQKVAFSMKFSHLIASLSQLECTLQVKISSYILVIAEFATLIPQLLHYTPKHPIT